MVLVDHMMRKKFGFLQDSFVESPSLWMLTPFHTPVFCCVGAIPLWSATSLKLRISVAAPTLGVEYAYVDGQIGQASTIPSRPAGGMRRGRRNPPPVAT